MAVAAQGFGSQAQALDHALQRTRAFAEPLIAHETLDTGENTLAHADAVAAILQGIGGSEAMQAASYLVYACDHLNKPHEVIEKAFGASYATLAVETTKLVRVQRLSRAAATGKDGNAGISPGAASQTENVRKMLLAFSRDLRVVMLRLASRLQTLRHFAATKLPVPAALAAESLQVFAPLANRLGIWQIKWEMEDLAFRFTEPETYKTIAKQLDAKRAGREAAMAAICSEIESYLRPQGVDSTVFGRPKHIYSIARKMRGKQLGFDQVLDVRALRVIVPSVADCYAALAQVHARYVPLPGEFDDYIAKPKANGYQSLHTVVRYTDGAPVEVQIRTQAMHDHAETGVAAHWAYKEAGSKGYAGVSADGAYDAKIAVLRQLLAWEQDLAGGDAATGNRGQGAGAAEGVLDDRIYVLTPEAAIVDLPSGATPIDFAYAVHTNLGHRCRGAKIDGLLVPLNTALKNGQTVEVSTVKEGGPSRDWLNAELGYLASPRARAKVRAWFNALAAHETVAKGREAVEKLLQREGKTAVKLDDLAAQLGFKASDDLFEMVGKDEFSLRTIEQLFRPVEPVPDADEQLLLKKARQTDKHKAHGNQGGVLVVGVDSLLTQLAKCCKPAPPDAIGGFVTRGKGVSIHRAGCLNLQQLLARDAGRGIEVAWGLPKAGASGSAPTYAVDITVQANDRTGLLRDIAEVFTKEKAHVQNVQSQTTDGMVWMTLTVHIADTSRLGKV
ncbi:MAG: bifunctional (p)ppGpp synthetase/guanosine-3',5'-bis(diphosphate) 3'-pyrophosphohydrolase, partial [Burkholderiaceae bacterium]